MPPPAEISIPSTILSTGQAKPYTLYNITLRLPLRSFVVQKRYSDFAALHTTLTSQVGSPPPEPLPGKSWFKSTVSSPELTEARRRGLETYLRAVAESPDRRWRDTTAWRAFLSLPSATGGSTANSTASAQGLSRLATGAGSGAGDPTTWLDLHREMKSCLHEARLSLSRRDGAAEANNGSAAAEAGAAAKRALVKAGTMVTTLGEGLKAMQERGRLGDGELRRRRDLLSSARVERDGLEKLSSTLSQSSSVGSNTTTTPSQMQMYMQRTGSETPSSRTALLGNGGPRTGGRVLGGPPAPETARTRELDNEGVAQLQKQIMGEQDEQVEALAAIVRRQKEMGMRIGEEIEAQTEMLDRVNEDADRVGGKVRVAKNRMKKL